MLKVHFNEGSADYKWLPTLIVNSGGFNYYFSIWWLSLRLWHLKKPTQKEFAERTRLDSLDHTGMTLDQLKAEYHVVSQRLARGIYHEDTKADLEERQDKLLLSIKRKERHA